MNIKNLKTKALTLIVTLTLPVASYASQSSQTPSPGQPIGLIEMVKNIGTLIREILNSGYMLAMLAGFILVVGGVIAWAVAEKTQNQQKTRTGALVSFVAGVLLCSVTAIIDMGAVTTTNQQSEFAQFYEEQNQ